ncbi:3-oxoacyl-[acyl-carrier-protein] reductase FabG-like [Macrobrachium nipponense]|uniref:3-oxoacyl-[acyl-carrier-protein] reductase FabG-like n=1 Tax=Macrobrachium nipponense TaxID=159736 RepID=UPI0030C8A02D
MSGRSEECTMTGTCHWGKGKVALVTGAARRVGKAITSALHRHGYNVVIHFNTSRDEAEAFAGELNKIRSDSAFVIKGDLSKDVVDTCRRLVSEAEAKWDRLDLLVNNASLFFLTPLVSATDHQWNQLMDTNVKAPYFLSQAAAPHLRKTKGSIINLGDIIGEQASPPLTIYGMSKAALIMASKNLAIELGPEVRVNYICPGAVMWPEVEKEHHDDTFRKEWLARTPLGKIGTGEDVADAAMYLASPAASYVTGTGINVCGGRSLRL